MNITVICQSLNVISAPADADIRVGVQFRTVDGNSNLILNLSKAEALTYEIGAKYSLALAKVTA